MHESKYDHSIVRDTNNRNIITIFIAMYSLIFVCEKKIFKKEFQNLPNIYIIRITLSLILSLFEV